MRHFTLALTPEERRPIVRDIPLTAEEQKNDRFAKALDVLSVILFWMVFIAAGILCFVAIRRIPMPQHTILCILLIFGKGLLITAALLLSVLLGGLVTTPICAKAQQKRSIQKREVMDKALQSMRAYYGWREPCMVTKCYDASDRRLVRRDICLFFADGELRLTADLKHGLSPKETDPGCYAFRTDELSLRHIREGNILVTELQAGEMVFRLGRRAKGFIEWNIRAFEDNTHNQKNST